jgi:hypothetical protein
MIKFHPSSLGLIMTEPKVKSELLGETCKKHLIEVFISEHYGRRKTLDNKWLKKGIATENESIRMFNSQHDAKYVKNEETLSNDYVIGTPDIIEDIIGEAKSSYDIWTFLNAKHSKLDKDYYWQCQAYMWLTGLKSAKLFYSLNNNPIEDIQDAKRKLQWKLNSIDEETDEYIYECQRIERNSIYDLGRFQFDYPYFDFHSDIDNWKYDIPVKERLHVIDIPFDQTAIDKLKKRIEDCNQWMQTNLYNIPSREEIEQL